MTDANKKPHVMGVSVIFLHVFVYNRYPFNLNYITLKDIRVVLFHI